MRFASLLVYVDEGPEATARVALACAIAGLSKAHVIGLAASMPDSPQIDPYAGGAMTGEMLGLFRDIAEADVSRARLSAVEPLTGVAGTTGRRALLIGGAAVIAGGAGAAWLGVRGMGSIDDYDATVAQMRSVLSAKPELADLVRFATLAPNGHNTQPWRFRLGDGRIDILPDLSRRTPVVDPDDHHLFVSLGGAAENLALAGAARGRPGEIAFDPSGLGGLIFSHGDGQPVRSALFDAIPVRQSTRADYDGRPVSAADLSSLAAAARLPGVDVVLVTDRPQIARLRDLVIQGNTAQLADAAFVRELKSWIRFNPHQALKTGDGLFSVASGNPPLPTWLGSAMFDATFKPKPENDKYAGQLDTSSGVAVFVGEREDKDHWTRIGRSSQRFALQATALGLKCSYINQPVEVAAVRPELAALIGMTGRRPDLVMRFGYGPMLPYSARRLALAVTA